MRVAAPRGFSLARTATSHGWFDLPPFRWSEREGVLDRVIRTARGRLLLAEMSEPGPGELFLTLRAPGGRIGRAESDDALRQVGHMLRLDEPLGEFYRLCSRTPGYGWVPKASAGRLLRAPDPFEDLVKLVCTTNCSWSLTRTMVAGIVEGLGEPLTPGDANGSARGSARPDPPRRPLRRQAPPTGGSGRREPSMPTAPRRAFPTPEAMAEAPESFYRTRVRAGYRAPHLREIARRVARGDVDLPSWGDPAKPAGEIASEITSLPGAGRYVAENMLKLLGRYEGLGLDSWCRRRFSEIHARGRKVTDRRIERHYGVFGPWRGLALWCDLTKEWSEGAASAVEALREGKY